ncbi:helix-turn-helix transcriptional regulator [Rhodococcus sp. IEGM 1381]|uniref:helix-turn-helix transcriptional regulator n=1 Tax=Rhodococcus sp. IEGM 1381 TaxID=3047085 RepID=UPI0024B82CA8|nr:helix-turn-helix transcriptional regulator [Rhodococcus sp. IEGM 1381]MDI9893562.1 helix-turn-helix transcriptional regulator [Rhodococcus sp. IEGM 1381]
MPDRKNATATQSGVLRPDQLAQYVDLVRLPCAAALEPWVENYWQLQWNVPPGTSYRSSTLPHPACTLSVEHGWTREGVVDPVVVTGVLTRRFDVVLAESGWVFGVKFRPGGYAAFTGTVARSLRDVHVAPPTAFQPDTVDALANLGGHLNADHCRTVVDAVLTPYAPEVEPEYEVVLDIIGTMLGDRTLIRVAQVEERCGIGARRVQRLFERYVGATPKWVLSRYRIHDALSELDDGYSGPLADLAARYGWFDQAHFTREFTELVGIPPSSYQL